MLNLRPSWSPGSPLSDKFVPQLLTTSTTCSISELSRSSKRQTNLFGSPARGHKGCSIIRRRIMLQPLCPRAGEPNKLVCRLEDLESSEIEHVVLVVSNCGTNLSLNGDPGDHDGRKFSIEARGH